MASQHNTRRRADRRNPSAVIISLPKRLDQRLTCSQILRSRHSTRQEDHIPIRKIRLCHSRIRPDLDLMGAYDLSRLTSRDQYGLNPAARCV